MGTGYTRNDTANNIADGNVINASDLDGEFDAIQSAFNGTTGHSHDGTTGEGPQIGAAGIANDAVALGTKTTGNYVAAGAVSGVGLSGSASAEGATFTVTSNATNANTASTIVARDASGNFSAGTITAALTGNVTGNVTGSSGSTTGNAATATALQTARTIAGNSFDGTANITIASTDLSDSGSIDAATLDSIDSTSFLRSDAADTKTSGDLTFADSVKANFGAGSDLQIYHDGSNSFIDEAGTGSLIIRGASNVELQKYTGESLLVATADGAVRLYYDNVEKLVTTSGGVDVTGSLTFDGGTTSADLNFGDNDKAVFGGSSDLKIYHDGLNSYIEDAGTGDLKILATNFGLFNAAGSAVYMTATNGGAVDLRHNNISKLTTGSGGITVTGIVTADGVDLGDNEKARFGASQDLEIYHDGTDSFVDDQGTGKLVLKGNTAVEIRGTNGEDLAGFNMNGAVNLYYDNIKKFETTSAGITVTGDATATGDMNAVDFNATSDERLKSNIRKIEGALDKVCQMNGMHYVLDGKEASGVIAQNVQTVAPEAVSDNGEHLTVAYNHLIGYLIEAVKELKTEVEELKNGNTPSVS